VHSVTVKFFADFGNVAPEARVMTDEHSGYRDMCKFFAAHGTTSHGRGQYVNLQDRSIYSDVLP
jgi:hypothetical protein